MGRSRRRDASVAIGAALALAALADAALVHALPPWQTAALLAWLALTVALLRRSDAAGTALAREGQQWYLARNAHGGAPEAAPGTVHARHDPLTLQRPRYRSSWLVVLEFRDGAGRTRTLEVWADAVDAASFSYLRLACLLDAAPTAREPVRPFGSARSSGPARRLARFGRSARHPAR